MLLVTGDGYVTICNINRNYSVLNKQLRKFVMGLFINNFHSQGWMSVWFGVKLLVEGIVNKRNFQKRVDVIYEQRNSLSYSHKTFIRNKLFKTITRAAFEYFRLSYIFRLSTCYTNGFYVFIVCKFISH